MTVKENVDVVAAGAVNLKNTINKVGINKLHLVVSKMAIKTPEEYAFADATLKEVNAMIKTNEAKLIEKITGFKDALERVRNHFRKPSEILAGMKKTIKDKMLAFDAYLEQERIKQQEKLRKQAEDDARKLKERADKAAASGKAEKAQALQEQAAMVQNNVPVVDNSIKLEGTHTTVTYGYKIVDEKLIPDAYWMLDEKLIGKQARGSGGKQIILGVEIFPIKGIASR